MTAPPAPPPVRKLSDYSQPSLTDFPHLAPTPNLDGVQFEIKPQFITMIERKQFSGAKERTALLRSAIQSFTQEDDESLYEAWERFKDLQRECHHHKLAQWQIIQAFYNGLGYNSRMILDSAGNGIFINLDENIARNVVEEMAIHNSQYGNLRGFANKGKHQVNSISFLQTQLTSISQKLNSIKISNSSSVANVSAIGTNSTIFCENCGLVGHWAHGCRSSIEKINAFQTYKQISPYSNTYNTGLKNNQNMSYNSTNVLNPTPQEALPSQPVQTTEYANAITLRSGSHYDVPPIPKDDELATTKIANLDSVKPNNVVTSPARLQGKTNFSDNSLQGRPQDKSGDVQGLAIKLPFPNRHLKSKLDKQFGKFLEFVKNL
ncbi:uncharacterized protein LOC110713285 [Chenopodium quinoa]|uniref:uncharacterized protein LOC110713285 n=1 Tax=Chenopodium quinoa TaxID=63459 RepID=UPI000B7727E6|nr:uncharacterized protein LOC110713285 [Chenopodium quinoa]